MTENPYLEALARVTAGRTASFAELARLAGRPAAARAAGRAVAAVATDDPRPWHRIVRSDGGMAPDPARAEVQLQRLRSEGARPPADADVDSWLKKRRARCVGSWTNRMLFDVGDPRLPRVDSTRLEAIRDTEQGLERGFYIAPEPRVTATDAAALVTRTAARPQRASVSPTSGRPASKPSRERAKTDKPPSSPTPAAKRERRKASRDALTPTPKRKAAAK